MGKGTMGEDPTWGPSIPWAKDKNNSFPVFELRRKIRLLCGQFKLLFRTETDLHKRFPTLKQRTEKLRASKEQAGFGKGDGSLGASAAER